MCVSLMERITVCLLVSPHMSLSTALHWVCGQVPVGGAVLASSNAHIVTAVSKMYPGRASGQPAMDVFVTLLSLVCVCMCMHVHVCVCMCVCVWLFVCMGMLLFHCAVLPTRCAAPPMALSPLYVCVCVRMCV